MVVGRSEGGHLYQNVRALIKQCSAVLMRCETSSDQNEVQMPSTEALTALSNWMTEKLHKHMSTGTKGDRIETSEYVDMLEGERALSYNPYTQET